MAVLPGFLALAVLLVVTPGPDMAFMIASGLDGGAAGALRAAMGVALGVGVYVAASAAGLAALVAARPALLVVLQLCGAVYLLYLSTSLWRRARRPMDIGTVTRGGERLFVRGLVVNLSNPGIMVFFLALLPQFVRPEKGSPAGQFVVLGTILLVVGFVGDLVTGVAAGVVRDRLVHQPRTRARLARLSAVLYAALAITVTVEALTDLAADASVHLP